MAAVPAKGPVPQYSKSQILGALKRQQVAPADEPRLVASIADAMMPYKTFDLFAQYPDNALYPIGAQRLAGSLLSNTNLVMLDVRYGKIMDEGAKHLSVMLKTNETVETLDLGHNELTADGVSGLEEALKANSTLKVLSFRCNDLKADGVHILTRVFASGSNVHTLNLSSNGLESAAFEHVAALLKAPNKITCLDVSYNAMDVPSAKLLADALTKNCTLTVLNLKANALKDDGIAALSTGLTKNATLQSLSLARNELTAASGRHIAKVLSSSNSGLHQLYLAENDLKDALPPVTAALRRSSATGNPMSCLRVLDVSHCGLDAAAAKSFSELLSDNRTLEMLHIAANPEMEDHLEDLCEGLLRNDTLHSLLYSWETKTLPTKGSERLRRNARAYTKWSSRKPYLHLLTAAAPLVRLPKDSPSAKKGGMALPKHHPIAVLVQAAAVAPTKKKISKAVLDAAVVRDVMSFL